MWKRRGFLGGAVLAIVGGIVAPGLGAQYPAAPASYSVTQVAGMSGAPVTVETYRDGSKTVIDHLNAGRHTRSLYDKISDDGDRLWAKLGKFATVVGY
jgi:hypothetical protein